MNLINFLSLMLAGIGDGHMRVDYDKKVYASMPRPLLFAFRVLMKKEKVIILLNDTRDNTTVKTGIELVSINGRSIKAIRKILLSHFRIDRYNQSGKEEQMERSFDSHY